MNMKINIAGVEWKNPVTVASGTFGSGEEFSEFVDLNQLGAVTTKGVANVPWAGNPTPRVAEVYGGMMNAIGLQNPGIDVFCRRDIPFLKQVFACMRAYMIDREDVRQAMQVIIDVTKEVKKGRNYLIFAEGTRSKQGNHLGTFKGGSFKSATKAQCPIVPVALIDSFKPFDTNSAKPVTVQVHFLKPMMYEDYKDMKTTEIAALVQKRIQETIDKNVSRTM